MMGVTILLLLALLLGWAWNNHWWKWLRDLRLVRLRDLRVNWLWKLCVARLWILGVVRLWILGVARLWILGVAWIFGNGNRWFLRWRLLGLFHLLLLKLGRWDVVLLLLGGTHALKEAGPRDKNVYPEVWWNKE